MKTNNKIYRYAVPVALAASVLLTVACTEMDDFFGGNRSKEVKFSAVEESDWNKTRGADASDVKILDPVKAETSDGSTVYVHTYVDNSVQKKKDAELTRTATTQDGLSEFNVIAYKYDKNETFGGQQAFFTATATKGADDKFTMEKKLYWPTTDERYAFFAYYPYIENTNSNWNGNGNPYIEPVSTEACPVLEVSLGEWRDGIYGYDLVTALATDQTGTLTGENDVELTFKHAMTAIRFELGNLVPGENFHIESIAFNAIANEGTYSPVDGWDNLNANYYYGSSGDYRLMYDLDNQPANSENKSVSLGDNGWWDDDDVYHSEPMNEIYMIPQEFDGENQTLTIEIQGENTPSFYVSMVLTGKWEEGKTVTYVLSSTEFDQFRLGVGISSTLYNTLYGDYENYAIQDGEEIGVFMVDKETNKVIASNEKFTYNATTESWIPDNVNLHLHGNAHYYMYRGYVNEPTLVSQMPAVGDEYTSTNYYWSDDDSQTFFADLIQAYPVVNDGTLENFRRSLLYTAHGYIDSNTYGDGKPYVNFSMNISRSAVVVTTTSKQVVDAADGMITYALSTDPTYTWQAYDNPTVTTHTASFGDSDLPDDNRGAQSPNYTSRRLYAVPCGTDYVIQSKDDAEHPWSVTVNYDTPTYIYTWTSTTWGSGYSARGGSANSVLVSAVPTCSDVHPSATRNETYTLKVGDIFYSDGGICRYVDKNTRSTLAKEVGIVYYVENPSITADNYLTEPNTVIGSNTVGGHGLVIGCIESLISVNAKWSGSTSDLPIENVVNFSYVGNTDSKTNLSGYENTQAMLTASSGNDIVSALADLPYNNIPKTTGWFIPSAAQIVKPWKYIPLKVGGTEITWPTSISSKESALWYGQGESGKTSTRYNCNTQEFSYDGPSNYSALYAMFLFVNGSVNTGYGSFWGGTGSSWYGTKLWTSSEYNSGNAVAMHIYGMNGTGNNVGGNGFKIYYDSKTNSNLLVPFLAF